MPITGWRSDSATHPRQLLECERSTPTGRPSGDRGWFRTEPQLWPQDGKCLRANALGGLIGGAIVENPLGASAIPFAAVVPALALLFILSQERGISVAPALSRPSLKEATL
jgi:hypothetical protein